MIVGFKETEIGRKDKKKRCAGKGEAIQEVYYNSFILSGNGWGVKLLNGLIVKWFNCCGEADCFAKFSINQHKHKVNCRFKLQTHFNEA